MSIELDTTQSTHDSPDPILSAVTVNEPGALERWTRQPKARGRQPRDPLGESVNFQCREIDDMENLLRDYIQAPTVPAEHATVEFVFPGSAAFTVYTTDLKGPTTSATKGRQQPLYSKLHRTAISVINALAPGDDPKDRMRKQKAVAKVCVEACEKADGFRYSFHNNWLSREDEGCRFSYFCNDSILNKGRAANEAAGMLGKRKRKPVYNCQGLITVKFSSVKQNLEVHYKHVPIHKTYAERAPPPRRDSRRRKLMELFEPDYLSADKDKRKAGVIEDSSTYHSRNGPTIQPGSGQTEGSASQVVQKDHAHVPGGTPGLAPGRNSSETMQRHGPVNTQTQSLPLPVEQAPGVALTSGFPATSANKSKRAPIPGTMSFSIHNKVKNSGRPATTKEPPPHIEDISTSSLLPGITAAAAAGSTASPTHTGTTDFALSELVALKKKLEEAEERIKKLESDKAATASVSHPPRMPQHVLWPPPPDYPPPPNGYPSYKHAEHTYHPHPSQQQQQQASPSTPVAHMSDKTLASFAQLNSRNTLPGQARFRLPPQRPFPSTPDHPDRPQANLSSHSTTNSPPYAIASSLSSASVKPSEKPLIGRKFVPYVPRSKGDSTPLQSQPVDVIDLESPVE